MIVIGWVTHIVSDLPFDSIDQDVEERHRLNHHRAVAAWKYASAKREGQLGYDAPNNSLASASPAEGMLWNKRHEEHGDA
jgi:hypothetical protein